MNTYIGPRRMFFSRKGSVCSCVCVCGRRKRDNFDRSFGFINNPTVESSVLSKSAITVKLTLIVSQLLGCEWNRAAPTGSGLLCGVFVSIEEW